MNEIKMNFNSHDNSNQNIITECCECKWWKDLNKCKEENDVLFEAIEKLININKRLKAENEILKEKLNKTNTYDDLDSLGAHGLSDW